MEMAIKNEAFLENYLGLLSSLSKESKVKLVESLNFDIKNCNISENKWIDELYGSFLSDKPTDVLVSEIRSDRRFIREVTGF
ncbi:MAG: hypothetical protein FWD24_01210 [Treponema sp.]|nr:hypothetical protein [Treponema sp.]